MNNSILLGVWRIMVSVPPALWQKALAGETKSDLAFMTPDHQLVRDFVVREMPRLNVPISPEMISAGTGIPVEHLRSILDNLERAMTFLFRNQAGAVTWAYPVTVEKTPHRLTFSSGEKCYAAWAVDALASPFVQGQLRQEKLTVAIETECGHCHKPIHLEVDSDLNYHILEKEASPLVFVPRVNFQKLDDPSIIDAFWRNSIFFWSEEHAREYRRTVGSSNGIYLTMPQSMTLTRLAQSALFAFPRKE